MSDKPKRIQRKCTNGWRMPEGAVYVGRPTKWGNPWTIHKALEAALFKPECVREVVVNEYRGWLTRVNELDHFCEGIPLYDEIKPQRDYILSNLEKLRGKDLACWCPLDQPCHADVLLELANA